MLGLQSSISDKRLRKAITTPYLIFLSTISHTLLILMLAIKLLLWALDILWTILVFMSPSFNQISLDFCLYDASLKRAHFQKSPLANVLVSSSSWAKGPNLSLASQKPTWFKAFFLLMESETFPNTSLLYTFELNFEAFNFASKMKLGVPLRLYPIHQPLNKSLKPSSFKHISSNIKGIGPLLRSPPLSKIGAWSKTGFSKELWTTPLKWLSHLSDTKW